MPSKATQALKNSAFPITVWLPIQIPRNCPGTKAGICLLSLLLIPFWDTEQMNPRSSYPKIASASSEQRTARRPYDTNHNHNKDPFSDHFPCTKQDRAYMCWSPIHELLPLSTPTGNQYLAMTQTGITWIVSRKKWFLNESAFLTEMYKNSYIFSTSPVMPPKVKIMQKKLCQRTQKVSHA